MNVVFLLLKIVYLSLIYLRLRIILFRNYFNRASHLKQLTAYLSIRRFNLLFLFQ